VKRSKATAALGWLRPALWLAVTWLTLLVSAACGGVLGIEDRQLDSPTDFPQEGYEGCRPGGPCTGCILQGHRDQCSQPPTASMCDTPSQLDACERCACNGGCETALDACQATAGCGAIWSCINANRCELLESSETSCYRAGVCQSVIVDNGGLNGEAFRSAVEVRSCAATSSCFICLPPQPEPPAECTPMAGCQGCSNCFQTCLCSGDTYATCRSACDEQVSNCSPDDSCQNCGSCFNLCSCSGGSFQECADSCRPPPCQPSTDCTDCTDCTSACLCGGADAATCDAQCNTSPEPACIKADSATAPGDCRLCGDCLAQCTCDNPSVDECMAECGYMTCTDTNCRCDSNYDECTCRDESAPAQCAQDTLGCTVVGCSSCACDKCPDEYALCWEDDACAEMLRCMQDSSCQGFDACVEACAPQGGSLPIIGGDPLDPGMAPSVREVFEALESCLASTGCASCTPD
jgi:hypothetical protein